MDKRIIKFRAWQKAHKKMHYNVNLYSMGHGEMVKAQLDNKSFMDSIGLSCEIMQFTGLLDKNGKEIYEGDIVRTQHYTDKPYSKKAKSKQHLGIVVYRIGHGTAEWDLKIEDEQGYSCHSWGPFYECEVIGNIFENPELLTP